MPTPLKIAVCGASGRTGSRVAALAALDPRFQLTGRVGRKSAAAFENCGAVIDFSVPEAAVRFAAACARAQVPFVSGTTGLTGVQRAQLTAASKKIPVFFAPNFSRAMTLMTHLASETARRLPGYDAAIVETHNKGKKDAPSGTALRLAQSVMEGRGDDEPVPTSSLRLADVAGEHSLVFAGGAERLEFFHRAESRDVFARGALEAALWTASRRPGLYDMLDMMGLK